MRTKVAVGQRFAARANGQMTHKGTAVMTATLRVVPEITRPFLGQLTEPRRAAGFKQYRIMLYNCGM